jgi:hypothetical protein
MMAAHWLPPSILEGIGIGNSTQHRRCRGIETARALVLTYDPQDGWIINESPFSPTSQDPNLLQASASSKTRSQMIKIRVVFSSVSMKRGTLFTLPLQAAA